VILKLLLLGDSEIQFSVVLDRTSDSQSVDLVYSDEILVCQNGNLSRTLP
jgi:hypothetical protein